MGTASARRAPRNDLFLTSDQAGLLRSTMRPRPKNSPGWRLNSGLSDCLLEDPTLRAVDFLLSAGSESPFFLESAVSTGYAFGRWR